MLDRRDQVADIRNALPAGARDAVQVSSVDAFQGCQKDVIILSLVRANPRQETKFAKFAAHATKQCCSKMSQLKGMACMIFIIHDTTF